MDLNLCLRHSSTSVVYASSHVFGHQPTIHNPTWIPFKHALPKAKGEEQQLRRCWIHFSLLTEWYQMLQWKMKCHGDENSGPHWISYTHKSRNKDKTHPKIKQIHFWLAHQCLGGTTGLDNQTGSQVPYPAKKDCLSKTWKLVSNFGHDIETNYGPDTLRTTRLTTYQPFHFTY